MVPETGDNPPGRTKSSVSLSRPARNERGESRREGELLKSASSPRPSPPFLRRRGRENAVARSKQIYCRTQLLCEPQHVDGFIVLNLPSASCLAKLQRVTDSRSGAWLCEPQHVRKQRCQIFATPAILRNCCASKRRGPQRGSVSRSMSELSTRQRLIQALWA